MISEGNTPYTKEDEQTQIDFIKQYVDSYRKKHNITNDQLHSDTLFESSCIAYPGGDIFHLLERQLMYTEFGEGSWSEVMGDSAKLVRKELVNAIKRIEVFNKEHDET